jgi:hypothetical protein
MSLSLLPGQELYCAEKYSYSVSSRPGEREKWGEKELGSGVMLTSALTAPKLLAFQRQSHGARLLGEFLFCQILLPILSWEEVVGESGRMLVGSSRRRAMAQLAQNAVMVWIKTLPPKKTGAAHHGPRVSVEHWRSWLFCPWERVRSVFPTLSALLVLNHVLQKLTAAVYADYARSLKSLGFKQGAVLFASKAGAAGKELLNELVSHKEELTEE